MDKAPITEKQAKQYQSILMDRPEAAAWLKVSLRTLDEQVALGNIKVVRIGRSVRFRESALEIFAESNETRLTAKRRKAIRGKRESVKQGSSSASKVPA